MQRKRIITYMNTKAVSLFEKGDNDGAVALLRDAVSLLVQSRVVAVVPGSNDCADDAKKQLPLPSSKEESSPPPVQMMSCSSSNFEIVPCNRSSAVVRGQDKDIDCNDDEDEDDDIDFFPHPLLFDLSPRSEGLNNQDDLFTSDEFSFATAVCLYNMALVHHRAWALPSRRNDNSQLLNQALHLYQQAFHILYSWNPKPAAAAAASGNNTSIVLLVMTLCKNLASISHEYGDLIQVKFWQSHLERAMIFADPRQFDRKTYSFFRISTMLSGTDLIAARAA